LTPQADWPEVGDELDINPGMLLLQGREPGNEESVDNARRRRHSHYADRSGDSCGKASAAWFHLGRCDDRTATRCGALVPPRTTLEQFLLSACSRPDGRVVDSEHTRGRRQASVTRQCDEVADILQREAMRLNAAGVLERSDLEFHVSSALGA
jgi:hypothetical protein